jgi:amidohydrolase
MNELLQEAQALFEYTREKRRDFHSHPELGLQEFRTSKIVAEELRSLGLDVQTGVAKTGVVTLIEGAQPGPVILLRFDMDALPIREETGAEYASKNPGVMHACGHDGHTAIGLTIAKLLVAHKDEFKGTAKLIFQPAEEGLGGADVMVAEGVLENPKVDAALALHLWNVKPLGWIGTTPGPMMAAAETFKVTLTGKGGHGAAPHFTIDPVLAAAQIVTALQSIVSRNVDPQKTAVVSVTMVHGGDAFNVIPSKAELQGTIRTFDKDVRQTVLKRFREIVESTADAFGCQAEIEFDSITPAVVNDEQVTGQVMEIVTQVLPEATLSTDSLTMGSEDMAFILDEVPGCFVFIGSANDEKGLNASHHHPKFDFDEQALVYGSALLTAAALDMLK